MPDPTLRRCRILVVEDEYLLADELRTELMDADAVVIGPAASVKDALAIIGSDQQLDGAIVDLNLRGEMAFPVADLLVERNVPFVFATGYDKSGIPSRFAGITRCEKPVNIGRIMRVLGRTER